MPGSARRDPGPRPVDPVARRPAARRAAAPAPRRPRRPARRRPSARPRARGRGRRCPNRCRRRPAGPTARSPLVGSPGASEGEHQRAGEGADAREQTDRPDREPAGGEAAGEVRDAVQDGRSEECEDDGHQVSHHADRPGRAPRRGRTRARSGCRGRRPTARARWPATPARWSSRRHCGEVHAEHEAQGSPTTGTTKKPTTPRAAPATVCSLGTPARCSRRPGTRYLTTAPGHQQAERDGGDRPGGGAAAVGRPRASSASRPGRCPAAPAPACRPGRPRSPPRRARLELRSWRDPVSAVAGRPVFIAAGEAAMPRS